LALTVPAWAQSETNGREPPMLGVYMARGEAHHGGGRLAGNMTWHGGDILPTTRTVAIFWGTTWPACALPSCDKITGIDSWYNGVGGSTYARTSDEYTGLSNDQVTGGISYLGHFVDGSAVPSNSSRPSTVLDEVCKVISANHITVTSTDYYAVYVDAKRHGSFCAYHTAGICSGITIKIAYFPNLDGDAGCDPVDTSGLHSQGLAALANVSGHEMSEARTDPLGTAWFDALGQENADKCAFSFSGTLLTFTNGTQWKIQGNWSNTAFTNGSGAFSNQNGQLGCIDGSPSFPPVAP